MKLYYKELDDDQRLFNYWSTFFMIMTAFKVIKISIHVFKNIHATDIFDIFE